MTKKEDIYCPICGGCGEDGCCSALNCQQHPDGLYCKTYLKDLQFACRMWRDTADMLPLDDLDDVFDKNYDDTYGE